MSGFSTVSRSRTKQVGDTGTTKPDTGSSLQTYQEIATKLPEPPDPSTFDTEPMPDVANAYTIPGDHIDQKRIPWNAHTEQPWRSWRAKFTTTGALYPIAARHAGNENKSALHVMYSPEQDEDWTIDASLKWRKKAAEVALSHGISGGVAVFHAYRVLPEITELFTDYVEETEYATTTTDVLQWEWLRRGNWRDYVRWGPHVHIIGLGERVRKHYGNGLLVRLRTFGEYDDPESSERTMSEHRSVTKDMVDHASFVDDPSHDWSAPFYWFGELQGDNWWEAEEHVDDNTINRIRDVLMDSSYTIS